MLDRWLAVMAAQNANSVTKSLSLTESIEFWVGALNPSASAVIFLSIGYVVPANAAEPRGHRFILLNASRKRDASRPNLNAYASMCCATVTGCACCMCVNPGMMVFPLSLAIVISESTSVSMDDTTSRTASLRYILKSTATWSFLLLPVCSFPPTGPIRSVSLNSTLVWMSSKDSSSLNSPDSISATMVFSPSMILSASSEGMILHSFSILTCASEPITS